MTITTTDLESCPPLVEPLDAIPDLEATLRKLAGLPGCLFLDSAQSDSRLGRYSFLTADPIAVCRLQDQTAAPADVMRCLPAWPGKYQPELPPFQGGLAGLFSYDLGKQFEPWPASQYNEFGCPLLALGLYDVVLAVDHQQQQAWWISQGWPETDPGRRTDRAAQRLRFFQNWLQDSHEVAASAGQASTLTPDELAPQFSMPHLPKLTSNFSQAEYLRTIEQAIEYIYAGDVFQVNLAQRLLYPAETSSLDLYLRLRQRNPAPFSGYFDVGGFQILSASPERFLQVNGNWLQTRPIKGTRHRSGDLEQDARLAQELRESEKDRAENTMILDLLRNDISRICLPESVQVTSWCEVETFAYVMHLVSEARGRLRDGVSLFELLRATFPGGSITGAPKPRALEIIAELEPAARGAYCGSLGYWGVGNQCDTSILIRTITAGGGWWQAPVGGGIVAASDPTAEYEETWHKAEGLLRAFLP